MKRREVIKMLGMSVTPLLTNLTEAIAASETPLHGSIHETREDQYHLVVYGGTPGGIACALRVAREGLKVLLVNHNQHLGGMFVNGLGTMDTLYNGARAPIYDELRYMIYDYYREKYGKKSSQYEASLPGYAKTKYESHVMKELIEQLIQKESLITVLKDYYPVKVERNKRLISSVTFAKKKSGETITATGNVFADCSYEGDLVAVAKTPWRMGRESKKEFGEEHAGVTYMKNDSWPPSQEASTDYNLGLARKMNLHLYNSWSDLIVPESTGAAHAAIQAFNIRTTLTDDPENRILPNRPSNYDPQSLKKAFGITGGAGLKVPNQKTSWNVPELIGEQNPYVEGNWEQRHNITEKFRDTTLAYLYFLQNDESVPEEVRKRMQLFGLPKNEYRDNGHMPYEVYVREARRIEGRKVFTEQNALLAKGIRRAPIVNDSISVTEWFMDSHACTDHTLEGSKPEGEVMMKNKTFPGQVSFDCIFPKDLDNMIVPVCLSSSHIGWGTIRLEPTWMSICEASGYLVAMAVKSNMPPSSVDRDKLLRLLAKKSLMVSFFNDMEGREYAPWYAAVQYLGTKGYFTTYEANPGAILTKSMADEWIRHTGCLVDNPLTDPMNDAALIFSKEGVQEPGLKAGKFSDLLSRVKGISPQKVQALVKTLGINAESMITRGDACRLIFEALPA